MNRTLTLLSTAIVCGAVLSCNSKKETESIATNAPDVKTYPLMKKAAWLIGSWGNTTPEGILTEKWNKENDSVYHGESYFVIGKDTVFSESIQLEESNGKLVYNVTVPGQNNGQATPFELTTSSYSQMIFENLKHDFPSKITYNKITNDSLVAEISGMQKGKPATETFEMKRQ
ncbi:DUF6265 family protein [Flavobacterium sp.]|uniref:DUF6265 family protein n=1 Tax=Flavobacterium sp. TaxID=239 RepID=UPI00403315AB